MRTKPEFSAPHSLQIVPIPTTSPLPAPACAGGQPQVSSQLKQKAPGLGREGKGPLQAWEVGPGESALEHAASWVEIWTAWVERGWRGTGIPSNLML